MGLEIADPRAGSPDHGIQVMQLLHHAGHDPGQGEVEVAATEVFPVRIGDMSADGDTPRYAQPGSAAHGLWTARMRAATDVGAAEQWYERRVVAALLAHVRIEIDVHAAGRLRRGLSA